VVIGDGVLPSLDELDELDELLVPDELVVSDDVVAVSEEVFAAVAVPIEPVQAITLQAITNAANAPATIRRRIVLTRRARSASSRRAVSRFSEGDMP
jgi:succinylarginine dihydrolase